jgi:hypothetical protein
MINGGQAKPHCGAQVHWGHPLADKLLAAVVFTEGGGEPFDLARRLPLAVNGSPSWDANGLGRCGVTAATGDFWNFGDEAPFVPTRSVTCCLIRRKTDSTARSSAAFGTDGGLVGGRCGAHIPFNDGIVYWDFGGQLSPNRLTASGLSQAGLQKWVFVAGTRGSSIYLDGVRVASQATAITRAASSAGVDFTLNRGQGVAGDLQEFSLFLMLGQEWGQEQVTDWTAAPFALFRTPRYARYFLTTAAAAGGLRRRGRPCPSPDFEYVW